VKFENQMGVHPFDKLRYDMSGLVFNPRIEISQIRNHYCLVTVDPSEGLGNDYSVINVFKLEYKDIEYIKENMDIYTSAYDLISLKQVMKYRSNTISPEKLAEVLHLILFNFLNTEKTKCTIEYNNDGKTVLACLKHVFGDKNEYAAHVMMRFLHRLDATVKNIGLKVHSNKNQLVKDYQEAMESRAVVIEDENTIKESNHFIKHITNSGNTTYKAEGSMNDDDIITVVQAGHTFKNKVFRAHMDEFMEQNPNKEINALLDIIMKRDKELYKQGTDYVGLVNAINRGNNKLGTTQQLDITKLF